MMFGYLKVAWFVSEGTGMLGVQGVVKGDQSYAEDQRLCISSSKKI
jgi:hypothetical protein